MLLSVLTASVPQLEFLLIFRDIDKQPLVDMKAVIPPPLVFLICGGLMWLMQKFAPALMYDFAYRKILFWIVLVAGSFLLIVGMLTFFKRHTTIHPDRRSLSKVSVLMTTGVFRYSRNPLYLGFALLLVAWMIFLGNVLALLGVIIFVWFITEYQIKPEEEALEKIFGQEYVQYKGNVRRWI